jgi:hypothetical protein
MMDHKPAISNISAIIMIGVPVDDLVPATEMKNLFPGTTDQTWAGRRFRGTGPVFIRLGGDDGRQIYYRIRDIEKWLEDNRYTRTDRRVAT